MSGYTMVRVTCHAPHPDRAKQQGPGVACGNILGDVLGPVHFIGMSATAPKHPDGRIWLKCSRATCKMWNVFRVVVEEPNGGRP